MYFNVVKRRFWVHSVNLDRKYSLHDLDLLNLILRRYVGTSMDPTIILRQVGADPLELAAEEGKIFARIESNNFLGQYSINVLARIDSNISLEQ